MFTNLYIVCSWDHELIKCLSVGGGRPLEVSIRGRCPSLGVHVQEVSQIKRVVLLQEVSIRGKCRSEGGVQFVEGICRGSFACIWSAVLLSNVLFLLCSMSSLVECHSFANLIQFLTFEYSLCKWQANTSCQLSLT